MSIKLEIFPLPLLKKNLLRCLDVVITSDEALHHQEACLRVSSKDRQLEFSLGLLAKGINKREVFIPEVLKQEELIFLLCLGEKKVSKNITIKPAKKWNVHLVLHSHTDLGFTAPVSEVAQIHNDNTDLAVMYCRETEHWPEGSRFKWTCEVSWQVQNYLKDRNDQQVKIFFDQVRNNNIEIGALYSGELTELLGHEQAARSFYYAAKLRREQNIHIETAMLCDVPGCTKGFVQIMAKSGIKNFIVADNNFIAPFLARTDLPRPFYWEGDDNTKVLSWYTDHPFYAYIEGQNYGLSESYSETRKKLPAKLIELESSGYQYDELQLQYAFDNFRIEFRPAAIVKEWNENWEYPKIRLSTAGEFLNSIRKNYADNIPVRSGDWTNWWSGIAAGFPYESSQSRYLHNKIPALEILSSCIKLQSGKSAYPNNLFNGLYDKILAFDEHSGTGMVWEAKSDEIQQQALREGYGFINDSFKQVKEIEAGKKSELSQLISNGSDSELIAVFNPLNFSACGIVKVNSKEFYVENVPPLGYKIFNPGTSYNKSDVSHLVTSEAVTIENSFFKVQVDRKKGCITSLYHKVLKKQLIKDSCNCPVIYEPKPEVKIEMGKYIPEIYNGLEVPGTTIELKNDIRTSINTDEIFGTIVLMEHSAGDETWLTQKLYIQNENVHFENKINGRLINNVNFLREHLTDKGILYFRFNLNLEKPFVKYDAPCAVINPAEEPFKGSCKDYTAVQNWVQVFNSELSINFTSIDAPLMDLGGIALQKYRQSYPEDMQDIYIRASSLNELNIKHKSPYTDSPDLTFRYVISADEKPNMLNVYKLGYLHSSELIPVSVPPGNKGLLNFEELSFIKVLPGHIQVMTIKQAESGEGIIIRIRETLGLNTKAVIDLPGRKISRVFKTSVTEEIIGEITLPDNKLVIEMKPFSLETFNIQSDYAK